MADPVSSTVFLIGAGIAALTSAASVATTEGIKQSGKKFLMGGTLVNESDLDFEVDYYDEIRGSWGVTSTSKLIGAKNIIESIFDSIPDKETDDTEMEEFVKKHFLESRFKSAVKYFSGNAHSIGFKGLVRLSNREKGVYLYIYMGKVPNLSYKAGVALSIKYFEESERSANSWLKKLAKIKDNRVKYTFSTGSSRVSTRSINGVTYSVKYSAGEKIEFHIKGGKSDNDILAAINRRRNAKLA